MAEELKDKQIDAVKAYYRKPDIPEEVSGYTPPLDLNEVIGDMNLLKLNAIFADVMKRKEDKVDPVRSKFGKIEKEEVTMSEKLVDIKAFMMEHKSFSFRELLMKGASKVAVIVTFLVVLELMKTGFITAPPAERKQVSLSYIYLRFVMLIVLCTQKTDFITLRRRRDIKKPPRAAFAHSER